MERGADRVRMWRHLLAIACGYAVSYVVGAIVVFLAVAAVAMFGGGTPEPPQYLAAMLGGRTLGGFFGGITAGRAAPANPRRSAAVLGIVLLVGPVVSFFRSDGSAPAWFFAALAMVPAACSVAGGFVPTRNRMSSDDTDVPHSGGVAVILIAIAAVTVPVNTFLVVEAWGDRSWGALGIMAVVAPFSNLVIAIASLLFTPLARKRFGVSILEHSMISIGIPLFAAIATTLLILYKS
jgi:hypothetical protein